MNLNGWKKIVISSNVDLRKEDNCLLILNNKYSEKIYVKEIDTIIIESEQVTLSSALMSFLVANNINIIFCDSKHNPSFEAIPYVCNALFAERLKKQIAWNNEAKEKIWCSILKMKIKNQAFLLKKLDVSEYVYIENMVSIINEENALECEAQAAKKYFSNLFGINFNRRIENDINSALNYGYSIVLSSINRLIACHGYNTSLGLYHHNCQNQFNFSYDLIEPFRPFVDEIVFCNIENEFNREYKKKLISISSNEISYNQCITSIENALNLFVLAVINALNDNTSLNEVIEFA